MPGNIKIKEGPTEHAVISNGHTVNNKLLKRDILKYYLNPLAFQGIWKWRTN